MRRANYFKIGLFVLGAASILVLAIIALGVGALFQDRIRVETYFQDSVQGLDIGSPVKFRGVQIGEVEEMTLVRKEYETFHRYVLVRMVLSPGAIQGTEDEVSAGEIMKEVRQGLRVRLGFQGVTGAAYIEADYLDPERYPPLEIDWEPDYPYIPAAPSLITRLSDAVDGIMRRLDQIQVEEIAQSLETVLSSLAQVDMVELSSEATALLREMRDTNGNLDELIRGVEIDPLLNQADATLEELQALVQRIRVPLETALSNSADASANLEKILGDLAESEDLGTSIAHLRRLLQRLDSLSYSQQQEIESTLDNLRRMSENLREFSQTARENPSQILFGEPPPRRFPER